ncbi:MAG TPA: hypothetical protein VGR45_12425 [Stellaceae bacterium]|nr:hypothetical protein [Stellaceae bacterium]
MAVLGGLGALVLIGRSPRAAAVETGRTTDTVRLCWGFGNLTLVAKERGEFEKRLGKDGVRVGWLGPLPNHAPTLQAVTGGSADFSFWRQHHRGSRRDDRRLALGLHPVRRL